MIRRYPASTLGLNGSQGLTLEQLFVRLCAFTTPYGSEYMLLSFFPDDIFIDEDGNFQYLICEKDGSDPIVQFCSHMDTACNYVERVDLQRTGDMIHTDGQTILGADCKIGVAIMLKMIEAQVPGWYVFHVGEEKGCIGASALSNRQDRWVIQPKISIEFDRHSYGSIITHQCMGRCCSEEFSEALAKQLIIPGYKPFASDDGGIYTDNQEYAEQIPEVTNISVGYFGHHTNREKQDIKYANLLLKALLKVQWNKLPIKRDPEDPANSRWSHGGYSMKSYARGWGMDTKDEDPWESEGNYGGTSLDLLDDDEWKRVVGSTTLGTKDGDYIYPKKPETVKTDHGYLVECVKCDHVNEFTVVEMECPFKFCEVCDAPLDADTAEELESVYRSSGVVKEKK